MHLNPSELLIVMLVLLAAIALLAERLKIAYPILLVLAGLGLGLLTSRLPNVMAFSTKEFRLNPDVVFLLFLPPLLYYAGLLTNWRDFKKNIAPISQLAVGLVLVTMVVVAITTRAMFPGLSWVHCFLLGAIVSPPDAVAATAVLERLRVPKRVVVILEGESMVNDATALVAYKAALAVLITGSFSLLNASWNIFFVSVGGIAVGLVAAYLAAKLMERIEAPAIESTLALLVPFAAYIPAEKLHVSGVLAAVAAGIYMGRRLPEIGSPRTRLRTMAVWDSLVFILNGVIFILIGFQLDTIVSGGIGTGSASSPTQAATSGPSVTTAPAGDIAEGFGHLVFGAILISVVAIVIRIVWVFVMATINTKIPGRATGAKPDWKNVTIVSWAGMRGIVTLAAAYALDEAIVSERPKQLILFISFVVVLITLVAQGFTLAPLIKLLRPQDDDGQEHREEVEARLDAAHAAVSRLAVLRLDDSISPEVIERVQAEYDERIRRLGGKPKDEINTEMLRPDQQLNHVRREALIAERKMITFMRDQNIVGDEVLRRILVEIDLEEAKLLANA